MLHYKACCIREFDQKSKVRTGVEYRHSWDPLYAHAIEVVGIHIFIDRLENRIEETAGDSP